MIVVGKVSLCKSSEDAKGRELFVATENIKTGDLVMVKRVTGPVFLSPETAGKYCKTPRLVWNLLECSGKFLDYVRKLLKKSGQ